MSKENIGIVKAWEATVRKSQVVTKKRANSIFGGSMMTATVAHADDDDSLPSTDSLCHVERVFGNGDFYTGQWLDNLPHGQGKYLWTDGCMYVGEWYNGKTMGKGKFSWPSGATYEGNFQSGYMDGQGTYTGSSGDTYRGAWVMNLKHGQGVKNYSNGDYFEGEWRRGTQDGHGRYQWKNGNHFVGQWKNGLMNGTGTMTWSNGNTYDGSWESGFPKGNGTYRWSDGSFYVGFWSKDPKEQNGSYYPSGSMSQGFDWNPQKVFLVDLNNCVVCAGEEKVPVFPSQKMMYLPPLVDQRFVRKGNENGMGLNRVSADERLSSQSSSSLEGSDVWSGSGECKDGEDPGCPQLHLASSDVIVTKNGLHRGKKQGVTISKGHKNYELMLNLQLGIRHAVGRSSPLTTGDLKASAFDPKEKVWTRFPPEGSKHTPPHQSSEFKWKDYCPVVFRTLRKLFNVDAADYMLSICGNDALRELSSPGKSGSFFYLTHDDRYMIKTIKKAEVKVLLRMLPAYYNHVRAFENTLVTKFFGLHCVKLSGTNQKKVRFVIMGNLFCSNYAIHKRFDLKGSSHGRTSAKIEAEMDPTITFKDLDLNFVFRLQKSWFQELCRQVDRDCDFLEQEKIMDYSLLVGLHFQEASARETNRTPCGPGARTPTGQLTPSGNISRESAEEALHLANEEIDQLLDPARWAAIRLGINMPACAEKTIRRKDSDPQLIGEPSGEMYKVVLFFGIIDILQDYDISKKLEHAYKSMQYDPTSISAVDPRQYSRRFRDFIFRVFVEDI